MIERLEIFLKFNTLILLYSKYILNNINNYKNIYFR